MEKDITILLLFFFSLANSKRILISIR